MLQQTLESDIFFDNNSNDGTKEFLEEHGYFNKDNIKYFRSNDNIGGAGGFSKAMQIVYEEWKLS